MKKIGLIISASNFEHQKDTIRAIHAKIKEVGGCALYVLTSYGLYLDETLYDKGEATIYELLDKIDFDGCILDGNLGTDKMFRPIISKLREKKIPFIANNFGEQDTNFVIMDGYKAICQLMTHLVEKHNCTKINLVCTGDSDCINVDTIRGYREILEKNNIEVDERRISMRAVSLTDGRELLRMFEEAGTRDAEAVVCVHDVHSIGLCLELEDQGIKVPEDMIVCCLIRSTNSMAFRPDISGADRVDSRIAEISFELLLDLIDGKDVPLVNYYDGEVYFGRSCGCSDVQDDNVDKKYQQLVLSKIEAGNQIRQMMQYNDRLDEVSSLDELMAKLQDMFIGIKCPQYVLCMNQGAMEFVSSDCEFKYPDNGKYYDDMMNAVAGYTERTGEISNITFPIEQLIPMEIEEGDLVLIYPIHHLEEIYGYLVFVNEYLPIDIYNYRICHESIASSMDNLHRQMVLRKSVDMLEQLHMQDALTGLYNRYAWERFSSDYTGKDAYCVAFMDMDGLKNINDNYGHHAGSNAIHTSANAIKKVMRENDLVTRYGGDEFQVLSTNVDENFWNNLQKVINDEIDRQIEAQNLPYTFGVSYGYCICDKKNSLTFEECCDKADYLMYENKKMRKAQKKNN
ncbi:MAG: GGDEF domain-containing protein [Lachnospiraceae bacterium]|nr:GGDEF domain-containing protein [Lachnospiraceae bacterium]